MALAEKRAQLYLPKDQWKKITKLAKDKRISFAELAREAFDDYLRKSKTRWENDPITKHIGFLKGHERDLSENHDHYIYDDTD